MTDQTPQPTCPYCNTTPPQAQNKPHTYNIRYWAEGECDDNDCHDGNTYEGQITITPDPHKGHKATLTHHTHNTNTHYTENPPELYCPTCDNYYFPTGPALTTPSQALLLQLGFSRHEINA